jgi:hypothetical protein
MSYPRLVATAVLAVCSAACASAPESAPIPREQEMGATFADGLLELVHADESGFERGEAMFNIRALRDGDEPVHQSVVFVWVPGEGGSAYDRIEAGFAMWMPPAAGEERVVVVRAPDVDARRAQGQRLARALLRIERGLRVPAVGRSGGERGSTYLDGAIECVGLGFDRNAQPQSLWIELENRTSDAIDDAEYLVALYGRGGEELGRTQWLPIDAIPGVAQRRIEVPLEGHQPASDFGFVVRRARAGRPSGPRMQTNPVGEELAGGLVRVVAVDDVHLAAHGEVTFVVEGLEDGETPIEAYVLFTWSAGDPVPTETVGFPQADAFRATEQRTFRARAPGWDAQRAKGRRLVGARLEVMIGEFVPVVARLHDDDPGSRFLGGALECVGFGTDDRDLVLSIELENLSGAAVSGAEYRVVFVDGTAQDEVGTTGWRPLPQISAGARAGVAVELASGKKSHDFMLLVRSSRRQER